MISCFRSSSLKLNITFNNHINVIRATRYCRIHIKLVLLRRNFVRNITFASYSPPIKDILRRSSQTVLRNKLVLFDRKCVKFLSMNFIQLVLCVRCVYRRCIYTLGNQCIPVKIKLINKILFIPNNDNVVQRVKFRIIIHCSNCYCIGTHVD